MIAPLLRDQRLDLLVALQTFRIGHLVAEIMALGTIAHALQCGMGRGEVTWRELRNHHRTRC